MTDASRARAIAFASWVGILAHGLLGTAKVVVGIVAGSLAVVSDGVDSLTDIITSVVTLVTAHIILRPPDARYSFGYAKAEPVATKLLAFIMFFAGAQLAMSSVSGLLHTATDTPPPGTAAVTVTIISIGVKLALALYKIGLGKRLRSTVLIADGQNMRNDVIISLAVLLGVVGSRIFATAVVDHVAALLVSIWIIGNALGIYLRTNVELMDGLPNTEVYTAVVSALQGVPGASNPHRIRIRKMGHLYMVSLDLEVAGELPIREAHCVAREAEAAIREQVENVYDVMIHLEPLGNDEENEAFGLARGEIDGSPPG